MVWKQFQKERCFEEIESMEEAGTRSHKILVVLTLNKHIQIKIGKYADKVLLLTEHERDKKKE